MAGGNYILQRPAPTSDSSARVSTDRPCRPFDGRDRCHDRSVRECQLESECFYKRRTTKRKITERTGRWQQQLFPAAASAVAQEDVPQQTNATDRGRFQELGGKPPPVRETGLTLWLLGYVTDALIQEDYARAQEHLALTVAALEQSGIDGDFTLGYLIALVEDPPVTLFQDRSTSLHTQGRPFAAVALSFLKELEILNSRKKETQSSATPKTTAAADGPPSPKRRPRYPRKPKAAGGNPQ